MRINQGVQVDRAELHQAHVVQAIVAVFSLPDEPFEALQRGGSRVLEKIVRAYHYWDSKAGVCPYDHPRKGYFRMTPAAHSASPDQKLHCEHAVPIRVLVSRLRELREESRGKVSQTQVEDVMRFNEIVVVTKDEAKLLDKRYKTCMPDGWSFSASHLARIETVLGLDVAQLKGNQLIGPDIRSA